MEGGTTLAIVSPSLPMSRNLWADFPSLIVEVLPWVLYYMCLLLYPTVSVGYFIPWPSEEEMSYLITFG